MYIHIFMYTHHDSHLSQLSPSYHNQHRDPSIGLTHLDTSTSSIFARHSKQPGTVRGVRNLMSSQASDHPCENVAIDEL